jgi:cell division protein FtsL
LKTSYAVHRPVVNAYLVRERDRRRWHELLLLVALVLPLGLGLLGYTWIHLEVLRIGGRIEVKERELERLLQSERRLELEAARVRSPARIEERARRELGMAPPEVDQLVFVATEAE